MPSAPNQEGRAPEVEAFIEGRRPFLAYLKAWEAELAPCPWEEILEAAGGPSGVAVVGVDLVKGFCEHGALASDRVAAILPDVTRMLTRAHALGVGHLLFTSDSHPPDSLEFRAWPPHCLEGSEESRLASAIQALPFADRIRILPKAAISPVASELEGYLKMRRALRTFVILGDVTDLCVYQAAMFLRTLANAEGLPWEVVVPASGVATYDLPVERAVALGALPHDGDLLHLLFLFHLSLNGVRIVSDLR